MSEKRKSESTISAGHEEKKPKDSRSSIVHSSEATSTKTMTTPTSVIQNSPQTHLNTKQQPAWFSTTRDDKLDKGYPLATWAAHTSRYNSIYVRRKNLLHSKSINAACPATICKRTGHWSGPNYDRKIDQSKWQAISYFFR